MNGYLVLENGYVLDGIVASKECNVLGDIIFGDDNSISIIQSNVTNKIAVSKSEYLHLENKFKNFDIMGKIVVDSLPIEYHMYDVKTLF